MSSLKRIALTCDETGDKVSLEDLLERYAATLQEQIKIIVTTVVDTPIGERIERLEKYASRQASSALPQSFTPSLLEIKGFVDSFEEIETKGVTNEQAD